MSASSSTKNRGFFIRVWRQLHFGHLKKEEGQIKGMMTAYSQGLRPYGDHLWNGISARRNRNEKTRFSWAPVEPSSIPRMIDLQPMVWNIRFQRQARIQQYCVDWPLSVSQTSATLYDRESKEYLEVRCHQDDNGLTIIDSEENLVSRSSLLLEGLPVSIQSESILDHNPSITWNNSECQMFEVNAIPNTEFVEATLSIHLPKNPGEENWQMDGHPFTPISITQWKPKSNHSLYSGSNLVVEEWMGSSRVLVDTHIDEGVVLKTEQGHPIQATTVEQEGFWVRLEAKLSGDEMYNPLDEVFTNFEIKSLRDGKDEILILRKRGDLRMVSLANLPEGETLSLQVRTSDLRVQHSACKRLRNAPLTHHIPLMRLVTRVDMKWDAWPDCKPSTIKIDKWYTRVGGDGEGSDDQRNFVRKAMATPDFAFLEGPPGSGKTETIGELILQILAANPESKILLCGSTQASIDNVLSRFSEHELIQALRVVNSRRWKSSPDDHHQMVYDHSIHRLVEPEQVQELKQSLGSYGEGLSDADLSTMVLNRSNLVAATIEGVANHPSIKNALNDEFTPPKAVFDYLIIDEASKTTFTQFLVPAIFCRKWVLVGDVAQLPPFANDKDISGILNRLEEERGDALRRACQIIAQVEDDWYLQKHPRIIIEDGRVIEELLLELSEHSDSQDGLNVKWGLVGNASKNILEEKLVFINSQTLSSSNEDAIGTARLRLTDCDVVIIERDAFDDHLFTLVAPTTHLHPTMVGKESHFDDSESLAFKFHMPPSRYMRRIKMVQRMKRESYESTSGVFNARRGLVRSDIDTWGERIAWRLQRIYELQTSKNVQLREKYFREVKALLPRQASKCSECEGKGVWVNRRDEKENECLACRGNGESPRWARSVEEIRNFSLPSILESLQYGYAGRDAAAELSLAPRFPNTLSNGFSDRSKSTRFQSIPYQHRMHPSISAFPRDNFYSEDSDGSKLRDAMTTLSQRGDFSLIQGENRRLWFDVKLDPIHPWKFGANKPEVKQVKSLLIDALSWFEKGSTDEFSLAILTPFNNQSDALREMMDGVLKNRGGKGMRGTRGTLRFGDRRLTLFCSTVDKFQGQEADVVILSLRTVGRIGKFDSPNRVNVALTRARECLLIVGHHKTYLQSSQKADRVDRMLQSLARKTSLGVSTSGQWRVA